VRFPDCSGGIVGLAIASNSENDRHLSPWQEAAGHEIIPDIHKSGRANEATTGLTLRIFVTLFHDPWSAHRNAGRRLAAHERREMMTRMDYALFNLPAVSKYPHVYDCDD
jgi:hypothetical protein